MTHTEHLAELCTKAAQTAQMTVSDLRQAHVAACDDKESALEVLIRDAMRDAVALSTRLDTIARCAQ
jgi:hypothetical protein